MRLSTRLMALLSILPAVSVASSIPYPYPGTMNPVEYQFTAESTGEVVAYFEGNGGALYTETLGMLVNGVSTEITGLNNQMSALGQALDLGQVTAGDQITFTLDVLNTGNTWYSQSSLNSDGANHVYSAAYGGSGTTPAGTYVGFEDLAAPHADFNYTDEQFVVTDVRASPSPVPLPSSNWLMLSALAGCVFFIRRRALT